MPRLFVAIRPPAAVRDALIDLMDAVEGARWQDEDQLHLTLRFVGDVDTRATDDIVSALGGVRSPAFPVTLAGVGSFGRRGRVDSLWAGVVPNAALDHLQRKVEQAVQRAGLAPEARRFHPHITLARGRMAVGLQSFLIARAGLTLPPFAVTTFGLFLSELARDGARYEAVARFALDHARLTPAAGDLEH